MVAFSSIKVGDELWDVHSEKMGNTTIRRMGSWPVNVRVIDEENQRILASWNGNPPKWLWKRQAEKLRRTPYKPRTSAQPIPGATP